MVSAVPTAWWEQIRIGVPIGLSIFFEASIFSLMTLLVASMFDTVTLAAHQVAMSFSSLMFMMPLSISMTLTIVVAYEVGSRRYDDARQYSVLAFRRPGDHVDRRGALVLLPRADRLYLQ